MCDACEHVSQVILRGCSRNDTVSLVCTCLYIQRALLPRVWYFGWVCIKCTTVIPLDPPPVSLWIPQLQSVSARLTRGGTLGMEIAAFSRRQSARPWDGDRWRQTHLTLSPRPSQMSFYCLVKNKQVQLFHKIKALSTRAGRKECAAIIYLFTQPLTELVRMARCISEDVSLSLSLRQYKPVSRWYHYMTAECDGICAPSVFNYIHVFPRLMKGTFQEIYAY